MLGSEPATDELYFVRWRGPWLLFMRGYATRSPDWLAFNLTTSEIRRLVDVGYDDVGDLLGEPSSPSLRAAQRSQWGNPEAALAALDALASSYTDREHRTQLTRLIGDAAEPV